MIQRDEWLRQKKAVAIERYNQIFSINYDDRWGQVDSTHVHFVGTLLDKLLPGSDVLDAACGTGKYWPMLLKAGCKVTGTDQSQGMLDNLLAKYPEGQVAGQSLQDLDLSKQFAAIICVDAMENVPPEDWPAVLRNFSRHLTQGGLLYLTVELVDQSELTDAFQTARAQGLPVVYGEAALEGYHYYPEERQVLDWLQDTEFSVLDQDKGDGYWHLLCQSAD